MIRDRRSFPAPVGVITVGVIRALHGAHPVHRSFPAPVGVILPSRMPQFPHRALLRWPFPHDLPG